jgi:hypothetical protein
MVRRLQPINSRRKSMQYLRIFGFLHQYNMFLNLFHPSAKAGQPAQPAT